MKAAHQPSVFALRTAFLQAANPQKSAPMAAYMQNRFPFLGIAKPQRNECQRATWKNFPIEKHEIPAVAFALWQQPEREFQYAAIDLLDKMRVFPPDAIDWITELIVDRSWWDTVDLLASHILGRYLLQHPGQLPLMHTWASGNQLWLKRSALLYPLLWKNETDTRQLESIIRVLATDPDFFVRKGIGWILRQYARTNPQWVRQITERLPLSPLSRREALKHLTTG